MYKVRYLHQVYNGNKNIDGTDVLGYLFKNIGSTSVKVNDFLLLPGDVLDLMSQDEQDVTRWFAQFDADGTAVTNGLSVLTKMKVEN